MEKRRNSYRIQYYLGDQRRRVPMQFRSLQTATIVADLIAESLLGDPTDPWPIIESLARQRDARDRGEEQPRPRAPRALTKTITVRDYFDSWILNQVWPATRAARTADYKRYFKGYILPNLGHIPLTKLTAHDIVNLRTKLATQGGAKGRPLARTTISNVLRGGLKPMINQALSDEIMKVDPFAHPAWRSWPKSQELPPEESTSDPFSRTEKAQLLGSMRLRSSPTFFAFVSFLVEIGARPSEAAGLMQKDLNLDKRTARIERSYHLGRYARTKTRRSTRTVRLSPELTQLLQQLRPDLWKDQDPVFTNQRGQPYEVGNLGPTWRKAQRAAGVRVRGIYTTKDTAVSLANEAGCSWAYLEQQTGVDQLTLRKHYDKRNTDDLLDEHDRVRAYQDLASTPPEAPLTQIAAVPSLRRRKRA